MCVVFTGAARRILNIELALPVYLLGNSSIWEFSQATKSFEDRLPKTLIFYSALPMGGLPPIIKMLTDELPKFLKPRRW